MSQLKQKKNKIIEEKKVYNTRNVSRRSLQKACESCKEFDERVKALQLALKDVIDQNDGLRSRVAQLEALISEAEDNTFELQQIITELNQSHHESLKL